MKRRVSYAVIMMAALCIIAGCRTSNPLENTSSVEEQANSENREPIGGHTGKDDAFSCLLREEMETGTDSPELSHSGLVCNLDQEMVYVDSTGQMVLQSNSVDKVITQKVYGGLNVYRDRIYYISSENQHVYSVTMSGEDLKEEIPEEAYDLLICEKGLVYTDKDTHLRLMDFQGNTATISEETCIWLNYYGDWLIFTELGTMEHSSVVAYSLSSGEKQQLLDYGLYPMVVDSTMYYQNVEGGVSAMDLATGACTEVSGIWGQEFTQLEGKLYFRNADHIYERDLKTGSETTIYEPVDAQIERMWKQGNQLIFSEKSEDSEGVIWKKYLPSTKEITAYE